MSAVTSYLHLPPPELRTRLEHLISERETAMRSHRGYLDRRARRGVQTPTDIQMSREYQNDEEIIALLKELLAGIDAYEAAS